MQTKPAIQNAEVHDSLSKKYPITPQKPKTTSTVNDSYLRTTLFPPTPDQTPSPSLKRHFNTLCTDAATPIRATKHQKLQHHNRTTSIAYPTSTQTPSVLHLLSIPKFSIAHPSNRPSDLGISGFELQRAMDVIMSRVNWVELGEEVSCNRRASVYKKAVKRLFQEKLDKMYDAEKVYGKGELVVHDENEKELEDDDQDE